MGKVKVWVRVGWWIFGYWRELGEVPCEPGPGEFTRHGTEIERSWADAHREVRIREIE